MTLQAFVIWKMAYLALPLEEKTLLHNLKPTLHKVLNSVHWQITVQHEFNMPKTRFTYNVAVLSFKWDTESVSETR